MYVLIQFHLEFKVIDLEDLTEMRVKELVVRCKLGSRDLMSDVSLEQPRATWSNDVINNENIHYNR